VAIDYADENLVALPESLDAVAGAAHTLNAETTDDVVGTIQAATNRSAHVSLNAVGPPRASYHSVAALRRQGRHVQIGLLRESAGTALPMDKVIAEERDLRGTHGLPAHRSPALFSLIEAGRLEPARLGERTIPLREVDPALMHTGGSHRRGNHAAPLDGRRDAPLCRPSRRDRGEGAPEGDRGPRAGEAPRRPGGRPRRPICAPPQLTDPRPVSLERRLSAAERRLDDLHAYLGRCGLSRERIAEVVRADGTVRWRDLSDDELDAVATTGPDRSVPGGPVWEDLTDAQLDRIADGEDPEAVVCGP